MSELDELMQQADDAAEEAIDLSDVESASFGPLEPGRYLCRVVDIKKGVTKNGDNAGAPKLEIRFKPVLPASNKPIFKHAPLTGKSKPFTRGFLEALGADMSQPLRPSSLVDALAWLTLGVRKDRPGDNEIVSIEPYDGTEVPEDGDGEELP